jgi:hypothetical protein
VIGVVANNVWAWRNGQQVDDMIVQYFINYNLPEGWYLCSQPAIHRRLAGVGARTPACRRTPRRRLTPQSGPL